MATGFRFLTNRRDKLAFAFLVLLAVTVFVYGCTTVKEVELIEEHPALDTIPFYRSGSYAYDTKLALKRLEKEKEEERRRFEEIKERFKKKGVEVELLSQWVPPSQLSLLDVPYALVLLPKDPYGYIDWQEALKMGLINPKGPEEVFPTIEEEEETEQFDEDIIFEINDRLMANVRFPHKAHNFYFSCKVCHPAIFKAKKGANPGSMYDIWAGKRCGRCHGKVAFQPKGFENCRRCHSVKKKTMGRE